MKVLVRAPFSQRRLKDLGSMFDEVRYDPWNTTGKWYSDNETLDLLQREQPDVFITELDRIQEQTLNNYGKLKVLGICRATPANVDVKKCTEKKLPILCTPARNAQAVAECLVGELICFMRHIHIATEWEHQGNWKLGSNPYCMFTGNEIHGKKIGFVGFGAVGKATAELLRAFHAEIVFYDPFVASFKDYEKVTLEKLFQTCDIVSIHLPVLPSTQKMINKELLSMMKTDSIFVNTARSAVVDMDALYQIVHSKKIKGAVMDVMDHEPPTEDDITRWSQENVLLTPHICGASYEVTDHHSDIMTQRLDSWLKQQNLQQIVFNKDVL